LVLRRFTPSEKCGNPPNYRVETAANSYMNGVACPDGEPGKGFGIERILAACST
jgi:hypothetical protein